MFTSRRNFRVGLIVVVISLSGILYPQQDSSRQAITSLISRFTDAATSGHSLVEFFSPGVQNTQRDDLKAISAKSFRRFAITDFTASDIEFQDSEHATVRVTVSWETSSESISKTTTLHFVNVGGTWYFANVNFWKLGLIWITPFVVYGAAYGIGLTIMMLHIRKVKWASSRKRFLWEFLSVIPGTLPLYFAGHPWVTPQETSGSTKSDLAP
jgi:uncharacterized protein YchJ